jgi:hypothetical protein
MTLLYLKRYSRIYIRTHSDWLFVYGDNLQRTGLGGQAAEARGECNAIGIATKRAPSMDETAFLIPEDYDEWFAIEKGTLRHLMEMSRAGRTIIWPLDGIGTGLAQLEKRAPNIWDVIEGLRMSIE